MMDFKNNETKTIKVKVIFESDEESVVFENDYRLAVEECKRLFSDIGDKNEYDQIDVTVVKFPGLDRVFRSLVRKETVGWDEW